MVMDLELTDEQWEPIDEAILLNQKIMALKAIRAAAGVSLRDAIFALGDRYAVLRKSRPEEFACGPETYWEGFYS